ncbi:MAG TPA: flagellar biosynthetic protein FliO [Fibrobacteraceae bacterium]|nr:flagellar biosynthetic protein FliO [Fibrobacteraceae bacterium]
MRTLILCVFFWGALNAWSQESRPATHEFDKKIQNLNLLLDSGKSIAPQSGTTEISTPDFMAIALRLVISLAVVLLLLFALYRIARKVRRMDLPPSAGGKALQLLESYHLGSQQKVALLRVGENKVLLLGSTPESLRTLAVLEGEEAKAILEKSPVPLATPAQFSETVNQMLSRFRKDSAE